MGVLDRINSKAVAIRGQSRSITDIDSYAATLASMAYGGFDYGLYGKIQTTLGNERAESIPNNLTAYARYLYESSGPVYSLMAVRMMAFSSVRFTWQQLVNGRPGKLFGTPDLSIFEYPWPGGTTQDLLVRMITDVDLAGNSYWTVHNNELVHLRPDWVQMILRPRVPDPRKPNQILGYQVVAYIYRENNLENGEEPILLLPSEVAHFAPTPDPLASFRGMSWLTPVIREVTNDKLMQTHQRKFFENGATPNMVISMDAAVSFTEFKKFMAEFKLGHEGVENAYRTLVMGGGADAQIVGADFQQMAFTATQGKGETRLAAAAGVPVTIVGFSEGLSGSSLNAGNFGQARRRLSDITMHPLWANAAGSMQTLRKHPSPSVRLWYDARDAPFLREDAKDAALILQTQGATITSLVNGGWEPETVKEAVLTGDFSVLVHTGLLSVQLQPPGTPLGGTPAVEPKDNVNAAN